jgi:hypothetical protein
MVSVRKLAFPEPLLRHGIPTAEARSASVPRRIFVIFLLPFVSLDCKEFAFAPAAPETVRTGIGVGE